MTGEERFKNQNPQGPEWDLFNLLEGELSDKEAEALLAAIEDDDELGREWEQFQHTVLKPEAIVYHNKSSLIKEEKAGIILFSWFSKPLSVAAAIVVALLISVPLYNLFKTNNPGTITSNVEHSNPGGVNDSASELKTPENQNPTEKEWIQPDQNSVHTLAKKQSGKGRFNLPVIPDSNPKDSVNRLVPAEDLIDMPERGFASFIPLTPKENSMELGLVNNELGEFVPRTQKNSLEFYAVNIKEKGLVGFMGEGLATLTDPFKNLNVKIHKSKDKKDPGLRIEVSTEQYYMVASVHLLPKNDRN
ncbi:MAG: hypothetical protein GC181_05850 [Bacteroidetes bacterium]|nr:hypothetical protein [Bacteroidota bacterium]